MESIVSILGIHGALYAVGVFALEGLIVARLNQVIQIAQTALGRWNNGESGYPSISITSVAALKQTTEILALVKICNQTRGRLSDSIILQDVTGIKSSIDGLTTNSEAIWTAIDGEFNYREGFEKLKSRVNVAVEKINGARKLVIGFIVSGLLGLILPSIIIAFEVNCLQLITFWVSLICLSLTFIILSFALWKNLVLRLLF